MQLFPTGIWLKAIECETVNTELGYKLVIWRFEEITLQANILDCRIAGASW